MSKKFNKAEWLKKKKEEVKKLYDSIEQGVKDVYTSEKWIDFLKVQSIFHSYSFNNTILILLQRPDATRVAGIKTWNALERYVKKGETGIRILAPIKKYVKADIKKDKDNNSSDTDIEDKKDEKNKIEIITGFTSTSVFDIEQTQGKELPSICSPLKGNSIKKISLFEKLLEIVDIPISMDYIGRGNGAFYRDSKTIKLKRELDYNHKCKTLIHEYTHYLLHSSIKKDEHKDTATIEVEAESTAFIVSSYFKLDTSEYSFPYIASWSSSKNLDELKKSGETIQRTANKIITLVENTKVEKAS